jgi:hypothetical protein
MNISLSNVSRVLVWVGLVGSPLMAQQRGAPAAVPAAAAIAPVTVNWLGQTPPVARSGVSWGVPWAQGRVHLRDVISLRTADGQAVPVQNWPMAYWPDESIKWSGLAISAAAGQAGPFTVSVQPAAQGAPGRGGRGGARGGGAGGGAGQSLTVTQDGFKIEINTGLLSARILKHDSANLFEEIWNPTRKVAQAGRLVVIDEDRSDEKSGVIRREDCISQVSNVVLEQSGTVRAVVKVEGTHISRSGKKLLPFVVRFYFYAGSDNIRLVHSFVFDGDAEKDFIKGLGLEFDVPLQENLVNRHVRFAGDEGMWAEPIKPLVGRRVVSYDGTTNIFPDQLAGKKIPNPDQFDASNQSLIHDAASWGDYRLEQLHPNGFSIEKRTQDKSSWLHVTDGHRAMGLAFLGDTSGGVAMGVKDFWQKFPAAFEINNARSELATMKVWLWSPQAPAMDMRHYDVDAHGLAMGYEDIEPGFSTPYGIANTSEMTLWVTPAVPANADLVNMAKSAAEPALLVCTPQYLHSLHAFGYWSLPDSSTPAKKAIETQLDNGLTYFKGQVDERYWYGMWNYGDMMRMYDEVRNQWKYDIGGWAWTNTELMPNLWLWYTFLRSGRADVFRLAEAMTRHTQEVDVYHIGRFAGLGSRHNVSHWGDGAKQPRISNAGLKNIYYYLTTDERTGDLLHEVVNADYTMAKVDPLRNVRAQSPSGVRSGFGFESTWPAFAINWMTEWERTKDTRWRDKIIAGMKSMIDEAPPGRPLLLEGGYDPETGKLVDDGGNVDQGNIAPLFGGPEICFQLHQMIDYPEFWDRWMQVASTGSGPLKGFVAMVRKDDALAQQVWGGGRGGGRGGRGAASAEAQGEDARGGRGARGAEVNVPSGGRYDNKPTIIKGPDYPAPFEAVPGRPETAGDGHRLLEWIEQLEFAPQYVPGS